MIARELTRSMMEARAFAALDHNDRLRRQFLRMKRYKDAESLPREVTLSAQLVKQVQARGRDMADRIKSQLSSQIKDALFNSLTLSRGQAASSDLLARQVAGIFNALLRPDTRPRTFQLGVQRIESGWIILDRDRGIPLAQGQIFPTRDSALRELARIRSARGLLPRALTVGSKAAYKATEARAFPHLRALEAEREKFLRAAVRGVPRLTEVQERAIIRTARTSERADEIYRRSLQSPEVEMLQYSAIRDERTCPICREYDGTILRKRNPWWKTHRPGNHPRCRCEVVEVTRAEVDEKAIKESRRLPKTPPIPGFGGDGTDIDPMIRLGELKR